MRVIRELGAGSVAVAALLAAGCRSTSAVGAGAVAGGVVGAVAAGAGGAGAASEVETAQGGAASAPSPLVLRAALPLEVEASEGDHFQPSGLVLHEGRLLTVSDKHDRAIYAIDVSADHARVRPFVSFEPPPEVPPPLDFEGLSPAPGGGWLVACEAQRRVLRVEIDPRSAVSPPVGHASWFSPPLDGLVRTNGCLRKVNAGLEGIALSAQGRLVLAGERDPRCLIELEVGAGLASAHVWSMETAAYAAEPGRSLDYSDLTLFHGALYALVRNTHLVVRLERTPEGWREGPAFSYRRTEHDPRYMYEDRTFGMAEGVAINEQWVYILLDNNENARASDAHDRRPILFVFERPPTL
jgi:hypothetical protein